MAKYCDICGKKLGIVFKEQVKDGVICMDCIGPLSEGRANSEKWNKHRWYPEFFTLDQYKQAKDFPETAVSIVDKEYDRVSAIKNKSEFFAEMNKNCVICGIDNGLEEWTSDRKRLCWRCACATMTVDPSKFLSLGKKAYIKSCSSEYLKKEMEECTYAHPYIAINYTTKRCYDTKTNFGPVQPNNAFSFDSIVKFETDQEEFEVRAGKKGHPIARAVVGNMLFGPTGAIVGAMTANDRRHYTTQKGLKYVNVYHRDALNANNIIKKEYFCQSDEEFVKLETAIKKIFEFEEEKKEMEKEKARAQVNFSVADELLKLKELFDMGVLSQEEFIEQKNRLLS